MQVIFPTTTQRNQRKDWDMGGNRSWELRQLYLLSLDWLIFLLGDFKSGRLLWGVDCWWRCGSR